MSVFRKNDKNGIETNQLISLIALDFLSVASNTKVPVLSLNGAWSGHCLHDEFLLGGGGYNKWLGYGRKKI